MESGLVDEVLELLHDADFARMRIEAKRRPLTFAEFTEMPMPLGMPVTDAWRLLTAFRRQTSSKLSWKSYQRPGAELWYTATESMAADLLEIEKKCRTQGSLFARLTVDSYRDILYDAWSGELVAALVRDGVTLEAATARELMDGSRIPQGAGEVALVNAFDMLARLDHYAGRTIDALLLFEFYGQIVRGTEGTTPEPRSRFGVIDDPDMATTDAVLAKICALYGDEPDERADTHFTVRALSAASLFWDFHPFPAWNALMEVLTRGLFFIREGSALLWRVPVGRALLDWEDGIIAPPETVAVAWGEQEPDCGEGFDCTAQFASYVSLALREVRALEHLADQQDALLADILGAIDVSRSLNRRQKELCRRVARDRSLELDIETYRRQHGVVYATARVDLLDLVDKGVLSQAMRGKAFVFYASRRFDVALRKLGG